MMPRIATRGWVVAAAVAAGCSSPTSVDVDELTGRWTWVSASGGIAGRTITPATEGYTMELRLSANGQAALLRSGQATRTAEFELAVGGEGGSFPGQDVIRFSEALFGGWEEMGMDLLAGDQLTLADGCCDGYAYGFVRSGP